MDLLLAFEWVNYFRGIPVHSDISSVLSRPAGNFLLNILGLNRWLLNPNLGRALVTILVGVLF